MRRGPKNKPTTLLELHGTYNVTRHRVRKPDAETVGQLDEPPSDLSPAEADRWRSALLAAPRGLLGKSDESLLRLWCWNEATFLQARDMQRALDTGSKLPLLVRSRNGEVRPSPYVKIMQRSSLIMLRMIEQLGFSPISRVGMGRTVEGETTSEEDQRWIELEDMRRKAANE
jgi:phage terminase small subunit